MDLSIQQSKGFSIFFWVNVSKITAGVHRFILKRGNFFQEITPSVGFLPNGTTLFVKILTSKHKTETLYSSKAFEINKWYNICATFNIDYSDQSNVLTDISLFIDGMLDSQVIVFNFRSLFQENQYIIKEVYKSEKSIILVMVLLEKSLILF